MNEAETRAKLIDPALHRAGWGEELIRREFLITEGRYFLVGDEVHQKQGQRADYLLSHEGARLCALEAKDDSHAPGSGLQQAKVYAQMLDLPFAYSSNGKAFVEYDFTTHTENDLDLSSFPTPAEMFARWQASREAIREGPRGDPLLFPYWTDGRTSPRYYQDVAVRKVIQVIQAGQKRILLAMATGTGKTYIASQIVWKLYQTESIRRVLFLADRVNLRDQAYNAFGVLSRGTAGDPRFVVEDSINPNRDIYFAIYQGLYGADSQGRLFQQLSSDFFDLIIIDECHRSGFGTWREILDYFGGAIHLGLTATPKRTDNIDTYAYFGDSVYSYSLGQGIDDGFLATYKVQKVRTNLNDQGGVDVEDAVLAGAELYVPEGADNPKDFYVLTEFERRIALPDWTVAMSAHLASVLQSTDDMAKTIVFCVSMEHALQVRQLMQNHFAHLGFDNYAVRIVSEERDGRVILERFRDSTKRTPVVATTVDLLTTGTDIPSVRNVVFMKPVGSIHVFKQMVGRGTRLDPGISKRWFRVIDYVNATRLFDDWDRPPPEPGDALPSKPWTGELHLAVIDAETTDDLREARAVAVAAPNEQVEAQRVNGLLVIRALPLREVVVQVSATEYRTRTLRLPALLREDVEPAIVEMRRLELSKPPIRLTGLTVEVTGEMLFTIDETGRQLTLSEYYDYAREVLLERVATDEDLRGLWVRPEARQAFIRELETRGVHPELLSELQQLPEADAFDILAALAFGVQPRLRKERVEAFLNRNESWLQQFDESQRSVILDLLDTYLAGGVGELEDRRVLQLHRFERYGGVIGIVAQFGSAERVDHTLREIQARLYEPVAA